MIDEAALDRWNAANRRARLAYWTGGTCKHGHPWTPANTYTDPDGTKRCHRCRFLARQAWKEQRR